MTKGTGSNVTYYEETPTTPKYCDNKIWRWTPNKREERWFDKKKRNIYLIFGPQRKIKKMSFFSFLSCSKDKRKYKHCSENIMVEWVRGGGTKSTKENIVKVHNFFLFFFLSMCTLVLFYEWKILFSFWMMGSLCAGVNVVAVFFMMNVKIWVVEIIRLFFYYFMSKCAGIKYTPNKTKTKKNDWMRMKIFISLVEVVCI